MKSPFVTLSKNMLADPTRKGTMEVFSVRTYGHGAKAPDRAATAAATRTVVMDSDSSQAPRSPNHHSLSLGATANASEDPLPNVSRN